MPVLAMGPRAWQRAETPPLPKRISAALPTKRLTSGIMIRLSIRMSTMHCESIERSNEARSVVSMKPHADARVEPFVSSAYYHILPS